MRTLPLILLGLLPAIAISQTTPAPVRLIGWGAGATSFGDIQSQLLPCGATRNECSGIFPAPTKPWAGGSGWDPATGTLFITDGVSAGAIEVATCVFRCKFLPVLPTTGSLATGFEIDPVRRQLWQVNSDWSLISYDIRKCPPVEQSRCRIQIARDLIPGGLAYDVEHERIFIAASSFTATDPGTTIFVTKRSAPCTVACSFSLPVSSTNRVGPITGLAYDPCEQILYATDGKVTASVRIGDGCENRPLGFCPNTGPVAWQGLTLEPAHARSVGKSCTEPHCPACNAMAGGVVGDAVLGNSAFALTIDSAPAASLGILALNVGGCRVPGLPIACGEVHVPGSPPPIFLSQVIPGTSPCGGSATFEIPIPVDVNLCKSDWCAQWVVLCRNTMGFGAGLTNAVGFQVSF